MFFGKHEPHFKRSQFYPNTHHHHPFKYKTSSKWQGPNLDLSMPILSPLLQMFRPGEPLPSWPEPLPPLPWGKWTPKFKALIITAHDVQQTPWKHMQASWLMWKRRICMSLTSFSHSLFCSLSKKTLPQPGRTPQVTLGTNNVPVQCWCQLARFWSACQASTLDLSVQLL